MLNLEEQKQINEIICPFCGNFNDAFITLYWCEHLFATYSRTHYKNGGNVSISSMVRGKEFEKFYKYFPKVNKFEDYEEATKIFVSKMEGIISIGTISRDEYDDEELSFCEYYFSESVKKSTEIFLPKYIREQRKRQKQIEAERIANLPNNPLEIKGYEKVFNYYNFPLEMVYNDRRGFDYKYIMADRLFFLTCKNCITFHRLNGQRCAYQPVFFLRRVMQHYCNYKKIEITQLVDSDKYPINTLTLFYLRKIFDKAFKLNKKEHIQLDNYYEIIPEELKIYMETNLSNEISAFNKMVQSAQKYVIYKAMDYTIKERVTHFYGEIFGEEIIPYFGADVNDPFAFLR